MSIFQMLSKVRDNNLLRLQVNTFLRTQEIIRILFNILLLTVKPYQRLGRLRHGADVRDNIH